MTARQIGQRPRRTHCFLAHSKHMHRCPHVYRAQSTGLSKQIEHSPSPPDGGCCETKRNIVKRQFKLQKLHVQEPGDQARRQPAPVIVFPSPIADGVPREVRPRVVD